jgi:hypothetical protein
VRLTWAIVMPLLLFMMLALLAKFVDVAYMASGR